MTSSIRSRKWNRKSSSTPERSQRTPIAKPTYDPKRLMDLALFYCSKRETSRPKLERYLKRKVNLEAQPEIIDWINEILNQFEKMNVINHERFADMLNREYARRGKGKRYIEQKLKEKGVGEQVNQIEFNPDDELIRATEAGMKWIEKSAFKKIDDPYQKKQKLLQKLVAQGFDYSVAKKAVESVLTASSKT